METVRIGASVRQEELLRAHAFEENDHHKPGNGVQIHFAFVVERYNIIDMIIVVQVQFLAGDGAIERRVGRFIWLSA